MMPYIQSIRSGRSAAGFSLIELMIALAIVAILAAVALPAYQSQMQKTRRADAVQALEYAAARQEQHFFQNNVYSNDIAEIGGNRSPEGFYTLSINTAADGQSYTLTATRTGAQADDRTCGNYSITQTGNRSVTGSGGMGLCWSRGG